MESGERCGLGTGVVGFALRAADFARGAVSRPIFRRAENILQPKPFGGLGGMRRDRFARAADRTSIAGLAGRHADLRELGQDPWRTEFRLALRSDLAALGRASPC